MKTRDLDALTRRIGHVKAFIKHLSRTRDQVNVLEIGCGLGVALSQLADRFPQVTFYGINLKHYHGQIERPNIIYIYGDAGTKLELEDNSIDFAFSQQTLQRIPDKIGCMKEVFRTLKKDGQYWYEFPPFLYGLYGPSTCTVSSGQETLDLQDYLVGINNPNVIINEIQFELNEGVLTKKMVAIAKKTDVLDFNLEKDYFIEDLGLIDISKEGYYASHYKALPIQKLPMKKKKILIVAKNPNDYIIENNWLSETTSISYITNDTIFMDTTPSTCSTMFKVNLEIENNNGVEIRKVLLDYLAHAKFDQVVVEDGIITSPIIRDTLETICMLNEGRTIVVTRKM